jgi:glycosyltransferase involved in cell wall biosynthesis
MIIVNGRFLSQRPTGVQRFSYETTTRIDRVIKIISPITLENPIIDSSGKKIQVEHVGLNFKGGGLSALWEQTVLPLKLKKEILYCPHGTYPISYKNIALVIHDIAIFDHPKWYVPSRRMYFNYMWTRIIKKGLPIITVSNFTKERLINYFNINPDKIYIANNAVDNSIFFTRTEIDSAVIITKLNLNSKKYVLVVGGASPRKNLKNMVMAWSLCAVDVELVVVGHRVMADSMTSDPIPAEIDEKIVYTGHISDQDLSCLYSRAIALLYCSLYEGFGIPILEAMTCGSPVITSNQTSMPEIAGGAAWLVNPNDIDDIKNAIEELSNKSDLRQSMINGGYQRAAHYTWDNSAKVINHYIDNY